MERTMVFLRRYSKLSCHLLNNKFLLSFHDSWMLLLLGYAHGRETSAFPTWRSNLGHENLQSDRLRLRRNVNGMYIENICKWHFLSENLKTMNKPGGRGYQKFSFRFSAYYIPDFVILKMGPLAS